MAQQAYDYDEIGKRVLKIRGRKGALSRTRKELQAKGEFKKLKKVEEEMARLTEEYKFVVARIKKIIKRGKVPQSKIHYCGEEDENYHPICYHKLLGKCFLYHMQKKGALEMKVDSENSRQCPLCMQMVFNGTDFYVVRGKRIHQACAEEVKSAYDNNIRTEKKSSGYPRR